MDAMVIRHLSRLCRQQAEQLSANINQFRQEGGNTVDMLFTNMNRTVAEYVERLKAAMKVNPARAPTSVGGNGFCSAGELRFSSRSLPT